MRRLKLSIATALALLAIAPQARAEFGLNDMQVAFEGPGGEASMQAGSHPYEMTTSFGIDTYLEAGKVFVDGALRNLEVQLPPGFAGRPTATPRCSNLDFLDKPAPFDPPACPDSTVVGVFRFNGAGVTPEEL